MGSCYWLLIYCTCCASLSLSLSLCLFDLTYTCALGFLHHKIIVDVSHRVRIGKRKGVGWGKQYKIRVRFQAKTTIEEVEGKLKICEKKAMVNGHWWDTQLLRGKNYYSFMSPMVGLYRYIRYITWGSQCKNIQSGL